MIETPHLDWWAIGPELVTGVMAIVVLLVGMSAAAWSRAATSVLTILTLAGALVLTLVEFNTTRLGAWSGQVDSDELANAGRLLVIACALVATIFAVRGRAIDGRHGEFHALLLSAVCGMGMFVAAGSFVSLFVGLELFSIALYVLCALDAERSASLEAGLKYLIVGGMSSAVLLYGAALVYGATGSLDLARIGASDDRGILLYTGAAMVLGGLAFKIGAAPMHWWTPDVYEGAPTSITAFMSTATKAVALLVLARVFGTAFAQEADAWVPLVSALAAASIVVGNVGALVQSRLKRMLAYSSIAQAGYFAMGIVAWDGSGLPALTYALVVYAAMTLGVFAYVLLLERELGRDATYADIAGRGWGGEEGSWLHTLPGLAVAVCALSLAGIPPTAGFFSKLGLFQAAVESGYAWLAIVAALGSVVSLGYYLRVIVELYMRPVDATRAAEAAHGVPAHTTGPRIDAGTRAPLVFGLGVGLAAVVLLLAFLPQRVFDAGCDVRASLTVDGPCSTSVVARAGNG